MKLVTLSGGLGNQMFQYAFYRALQQAGNGSAFLYKNKIIKHKEHNGYELQRLFRVEEHCNGLWLTHLLQTPLIGSLLKHLLFPKKVRERILYDYTPYRRYVETNPFLGIHLVGYWQSERFFEDIAEEIRSTFTFPETKLNTRTQSCKQAMKGRQNVSIHVRRTDYLHPDFAQMYGNLCTPDYYARSIAYIRQRVKSPVFHVFSDDMEWAQSHLPLSADTIWIDWNRGIDSWQDLYLMSQCQHNILANSSFSWWGGWLNANPNKIVVAPTVWVRSMEAPDITPKTWTRL
ncbi:MAG: alpha-1,2-fucosyltransferase [Clostridium sp.]|nr:alpha-1,2-fucosyltransferase [Clostridium sp.]